MTRLVLSPSLLAINRHLAVVKPSARDRGEAAREAGNAFEREVRAVFGGLHARGVVKHWTWTGPPSKYVRREGRLELVPTGPAPCDIVGVLPDARGFVAEVKHEADGLALHPGVDRKGRPGAGLQRHQREQLDVYDDAGAVAVLVVEIAGVRAVIPWSEARGLRRLGKRATQPWACDLAAGMEALCDLGKRS